MDTRAFRVGLVVLVASSGCYRSHERPEDGGVVETGAHVARCPEDEGILGTGAWRIDVVPPPPGRAALRVVAAERSPVLAGLGWRPAIPWNGDGFAVVLPGWTSEGMPSRLVVLDRHGLSSGTFPVGLVHLTTLDYACGQYFVAAADTERVGSALAVLDEVGEVAEDWMPFPGAEVTDVAAIGSAWGALLRTDDRSGLELVTIDREAPLAPRTFALRGDDVRGEEVLLGDARSGLAVWSEGPERFASLFAQRIEDGAPRDAPVLLVSELANSTFAATLVRDRLVVSVLLGFPATEHVLAFERARFAEVGRAEVVRDRGVSETRPHLASAWEAGFVARCESDGRTRPRTDVRLYGLDGAPWGDPILVPGSVVACEWNGEELLVFATLDLGEIEVTRLRPTFL